MKLQLIVTIQMKATKLCFHVVFIKLYKLIFTFKSVGETTDSVTIQMKATEHFHIVIFQYSGTCLMTNHWFDHLLNITTCLAWRKQSVTFLF